jgi:hypothetical protein
LSGLAFTGLPDNQHAIYTSAKGKPGSVATFQAGKIKLEREALIHPIIAAEDLFAVEAG